VSARTNRATCGGRSGDSQTVPDPTWETPHPAIEPTCATGSGATSPTSFTVARAKPAVNLSGASAAGNRVATASKATSGAAFRIGGAADAAERCARHGPVCPRARLGVRSGLSAASGVPVRSGSAMAPTRLALRASGRGCGRARPAALGRAATHQGGRENLRPVRGVGHLIVLVIVNGRPVRIRPMLEQVEIRVSRPTRAPPWSRRLETRRALRPAT
jgi:hypothetical protein